MTLMLFHGLGASAAPVRQQQVLQMHPDHRLDMMFDFEQQQVLQVPVGVQICGMGCSSS